MSRILITAISLACCSTALADPLLYVCERPAWDGKEGCGLNNTYYTYNLFVDTRDFKQKNPMYTFQMRKGCDASKGRKQRYHYKVNDETIVFWFQQSANSHKSVKPVIKLDRESMTAVMTQTEHSPELTCRVEEA